MKATHASFRAARGTAAGPEQIRKAEAPRQQPRSPRPLRHQAARGWSVQVPLAAHHRSLRNPHRLRLQRALGADNAEKYRRHSPLRVSAVAAGGEEHGPESDMGDPVARLLKRLVVTTCVAVPLISAAYGAFRG